MNTVIISSLELCNWKGFSVLVTKFVPGFDRACLKADPERGGAKQPKRCRGRGKKESNLMTSVLCLLNMIMDGHTPL